MWKILILVLLVSPLWPAWANTREAVRLKQLRTAQVQLTQAQTQLIRLTTQVEALQKTIQQTRTTLLDDLAQFNVVTRDLSRLSQVPQEVQVLHQMLQEKPSRHGLLKQSQQGLQQGLKEKQVALATLLAQQEALATLQQTQLSQTETVRHKRDRLARYRTIALNKLGGIGLEQRMARVLPRGASVTTITRTNLQPLAEDAPIAGFVQPSNLEERVGVQLRGVAGGMVKATHSGVVAFSGPFRAYGHLIILKNDKGVHTLYGGVLPPALFVGDSVQKGQVIAQLPQTPEPVLYYETRLNGRTVAPAIALK